MVSADNTGAPAAQGFTFLRFQARNFTRPRLDAGVTAGHRSVMSVTTEKPSRFLLSCQREDKCCSPDIFSHDIHIDMEKKIPVVEEQFVKHSNLQAHHCGSDHLRPRSKSLALAD